MKAFIIFLILAQTGWTISIIVRRAIAKLRKHPLRTQAMYGESLANVTVAVVVFVLALAVRT